MKREKGITLIALVVTIVVLIILAAVSISMLTGENGIITQAQNSKEATEQARVEELVDLAVNSLIGENQGSTNGITPEMVAEEVNEMENRDDIYAEGSTFPTNIIFPEEKRKVEVNLEQKKDLSEMYEVAVDEKDIAPMDLFDYEIIDEAETSALKLSALPTKKVRITKIKEEYCNSYKYLDIDTNYEINYKGNKISDTLVIPYKVDGKYVNGGIEGEIYTITEVQLYAEGKDNTIFSGYSFPRVETVIYPNTVEKIYGKYSDMLDGKNDILKMVVLPNSLKTIGNNSFYNCTGLVNIEIPDSVTNIEENAFGYYNGQYSNVTPNLKNIIIPISVTNMGENVFDGWTSSQTINVPFKEGEKSDGWDEYWKSGCDATINYLK